MEEKIIIKSEQYSLKKPIRIILIVGVILALFLAIFTASDYISSFNQSKKSHEHDYFCLKEEYEDESIEGDVDHIKEDYKFDCRYGRYANGFTYTFSQHLGNCFLPPFSIIVLFVLFCGCIYFLLRSYELTVTDKRIFGKVIFGKRVDLPFDSISSTSTISLFKGVAVATSSGRISFLAVKNSEEIFDKINALLIERQKAKKEAAPIQATANQHDEVDKLKKYKELLDQGIITQEEFDKKKKELLGL